jgi:hypothetical protein
MMCVEFLDPLQSQEVCYGDESLVVAKTDYPTVIFETSEMRDKFPVRGERIRAVSAEVRGTVRNEAMNPGRMIHWHRGRGEVCVRSSGS